MHSIKLQTEESKGSRVRLQQSNFFEGRRSDVEDRSKRTETVRPQFGEPCDERRECDSASSVKSDGNDIELNGARRTTRTWRTGRRDSMTGVRR